MTKHMNEHKERRKGERKRARRGRGLLMAWRPGPPPSPGLPTSDYDQRDPWTQRFISKTDGGELSLDVNVRF